MRASCCARNAAFAVFLLLSVTSIVPETASPAQPGISALDPAFRLPAGGRALVGPVLDAGSAPAAVWLLSEDGSLYALTEQGSLVTRVELPGDALAGGGVSAIAQRDAFSLALDPFGRAILSSGGTRLSAYTRMGALAWQRGIEGTEGGPYPPVFGSDGRAFVLSGKSLICLNPAGLRLWSLALPAPASCAPGVDGRGYPCLGLADGSLLIASPYGAVLGVFDLGSPASLLHPLAFPTKGAGDPPLLAAATRDGRLLLIRVGGISSSFSSASEILSLAFDGASVLALDAKGGLSALSPEARVLWSAPTGCLKGALYLFAERIVAAGQGRVVSLSRGGEVFRELTIPGASGTPVVSPAGLAFSSGKDWILAAYRYERPLGPPLSPALQGYPGLSDIVARELRFDPLASDSGSQLKRLADIEKSLRSGTIGRDEPEAAAYCAAIASRALDRALSQADRRRSENPLPRSRACYLLGLLGSPDYRGPLFGVLEGEADPALRISACEALGSMAVDRDGLSMAAFLAAVSRPVDDETAAALVAAIESIELRSGPGPSDEGLRTLVRLTAAPYGLSVRDRALAALGRISGFIR